MKLSEMNTEQLADALVGMAEPIENIAKDEELNAALNRMAEEQVQKKTTLQQIEEIVSAFLPALLVRHRADVYKVLSALTGKPIKELAGQPGMLTIREAREALLDRDFIDFFKSSGT